MRRKEKGENRKVGRLKWNEKQDVPFNNSFFSPANVTWWNEIKNWVPDVDKPVVLLPCSRHRPYKSSMTHQLMSPVTREPRFIKVVLSEPLVIVPYHLESLTPPYNYPPSTLLENEIEIQAFIKRLREWLSLVLERTGRRKYYYVGGRHHLNNVLLKAVDPLPIEVTFKLSKKGIAGFTSAARGLRRVILNDLKEGRFF